MKISLVTVTWNRRLQLERGLYTILIQTKKPDEIIVVDDGSTDGTRDFLNNQRNLTNIRPIYLDSPQPRISCIPRNIGWKAATGDWVIFTESECLHIGDTIEQLEEKIIKDPEHSHLATQVWTMGQRIYQKLNDDTFRHPRRILNHEFAQLTDSPNTTNLKAPDSDWAITGQSHISAGCLFAVKKEWLEAIGGFDESFEGHGFDDFDLYNRLGIYGHGMVGHSDIVVIHQWHEKNYPYNIYDMAERNGKISEANVKAGKYKVNE